LSFLDPAQRRNLIADTGGLLIFQRGGGFLHAGHQPVDHGTVAAFQKQHRVSHVLGVVFRADIADAGGGAAFDLVLQAGSGTVAEEAVLALAHPEEFLQQMQTLPDGTGAGIGTEIAPLAALRPAVEGQSRILLVG